MSKGFEKITPVNGFDTGNPINAKQNNYAWSMEEMGDYLYVGTGRNIVYAVINTGTFPGLKVPPELVPEYVDMNAEIWRYKKDDSAFRCLYFVDDRLEPFFELAPEFCPGDEGSQVQCKEPLVF